MRRVVREFVGPDVEIAFSYVDDIPVRGWKFRAVVSHARLSDVPKA